MPVTGVTMETARTSTATPMAECDKAQQTAVGRGTSAKSFIERTTNIGVTVRRDWPIYLMMLLFWRHLRPPAGH